MTFIIGTPHVDGAGYYRNDDTPSGGKKAEADIRTCKHCQAIIKLQEWKEDGGFCRRCDAPICNLCATRMLTFGCEPFLRELEKQASDQMRFIQFAKLAGLEAPLPPDITEPKED
jgi:hypothetical protein